MTLLLAPLAVACGRAIVAERSSQAQTPGATPAAETPSAPPSEGDMWTPPTEGGFAAEPLDIYYTVEELIRGSDFIVIGTVEQSVVGEVFDDSSKYPTIIVHTTLVVEEELKGSLLGGEVIVPTQELEFVGAEQDWRVAGNRVLLFLDPSRERDEPFQILAGLNHWHTTYLLQGDDIEPATAYDYTGLSEEVAAMTVSELRQMVERISS
ncbi:MAG TPA: hypothetical protein VHL78_00485 [Actinomycetota bacterium]|nr:hypothetical protein [Actinomycetota bacterium]